jgi:hypothetical protein
MNLIPVNLYARWFHEFDVRNRVTGNSVAGGHCKGLIGAEGVVFDTALPTDDGIQVSMRSYAVPPAPTPLRSRHGDFEESEIPISQSLPDTDDGLSQHATGYEYILHWRAA